MDDQIYSLREHPKFDSLVRTRMKHNNIKALSKVLADSSIGTQSYCPTNRSFGRRIRKATTIGKKKKGT